MRCSFATSDRVALACVGIGAIPRDALYLGLPLLQRTAKDVAGKEMSDAGLLEISGQRDPLLCALLEQLHAELTSIRRPSELFVQGIAQSLAVHLVRTYSDPQQRSTVPRGGLPAYKLQRVIDLLQSSLQEECSLQRLAHEAGLSEFHFCRAFSTRPAPAHRATSYICVSHAQSNCCARRSAA